MDVCIIVPTYNNEDYTIRCFDSIFKNTELDYKIIWVDNASEKESRDKVEEFVDKNKLPVIKIFNKENLGFVDGTNQGIEESLKHNPRYIVFENNDTEVYPGWIEGMIRVAESDPDIGIVGPITTPCDSWQAIDHLKKTVKEFADFPPYDGDKEKYARILRKKYKGKKKRVYTMVAFFSTLIKTETINQVGMLSKDYGEGFGDDDDYCTRAINQGWKIYLALEVFVFHNHRTTFKLKYSEEEIKQKQKKNLNIFKEKHKGYYQNIFESPQEVIDDLNRKIIERDETINQLNEKLNKMTLGNIIKNKIKFLIFSPHKLIKKYFKKIFK